MSRRGFALALILLVLALMLVILAAVVGLGRHHLGLVNSNARGVTSAYAAEAGIQLALADLKKDAGWSAGYTNHPLGGERSARVSVDVLNNLQGATTRTASDGTSVPAGLAYLLATGSCDSGSPRRIAVMVARGEGWKFPYILSSGASMDLKAGADIRGSLKSNGNISFSANTDVWPVEGRGDVLAGGQVDNGSKNLNMQGSGQEVRARQEVTNPSKVNGASLVASFDTSSETDPFTCDGRTDSALGSGERGEVLPNPLPSALLAANVTHLETEVSGLFDLGQGAVHWFPNGVRFKSSTSFAGNGTVVVGGSHDAIFDCGAAGHGSAYLKLNVIVIGARGPADVDASGRTPIGTGQLIFNGLVRLEGLLYSHGDITFGAATDVRGAIVSYSSGADVRMEGGGSKDLELVPLPVMVQGFENFWGWGGGSAFAVRSWQRL